MKNMTGFAGWKAALRLLAPAAAAAWIICPAAAEERTEILIELQTRGAKITLAVVPAAPAEPTGQTVTLIRKNLVLSDIFHIVDAPGLEGVSQSLDLSDADRQAANLFSINYLAKIKSDLPAGSFKVSVELYEISSGRKMLRQEYKFAQNQLREAGNRVADDITRALTGEKGTASTRIAFINNSTGHKELYVMDSDGENVKQLTWDESTALLPSWSADGKRIYFTSYRNNNPDVFCINADGSGMQSISQRAGLNISAALSPDEKWLAITLSRDDDPELYLLTPKGKLARRLTRSPGTDTSPSWAPNSRQIIYMSERSGMPQLYITDVDGLTSKAIPIDGFCDQPCWSAVGDRLLFVKRSGGIFDIFSTDLLGSPPIQLTQGVGSNERPCFSPDGRHIAFASNRSGRWRIYRMKADGSDVTPVGNLPGSSINPAWSP